MSIEATRLARALGAVVSGVDLRQELSQGEVARLSVRAKDSTAAGPADCTTTPLPTNSPTPMTPPKAIISM